MNIRQLLMEGYAEVIKAAGPDVEQIKQHLTSLFSDIAAIEQNAKDAVDAAIKAAKDRAGL